MLKDITTIDDIHHLVDDFYGKVRANGLIGPIFNEKLKDEWAPHLIKMYSFWQTVLLGEHTYTGKPFPPHAQLIIDRTHFQEWLRLWEETVDDRFKGDKAEEAKWRGNKMADLFEAKFRFYQQSTHKPLL